MDLRIDPLRASAQAFVPMIEAHREALDSLVVPGMLVDHRLPAQPALVADGLPTLEADDEEAYPLAVFWAHGQLWRVDRLHRDEDDYATGAGRVQAIAPPEGVQVGDPVQGMLPGQLPWRFLMTPDDPRRMDNAAWRDLAPGVAAMDWEDQDDFERALAHVLKAELPYAYGYTVGRLGGAESPIQDSHHHVRCPACQQPMAFLGQLDEDSGFAFADAGACYFLACPEHPEHTHFDAQTH